MNYQQITLLPGKDKSVRRYHPWVFSGAIKSKDEGVNEGDIVEVYSHKSKYLGTGLYQEASISVQIISFSQEEINDDFWRNKITQSVKLRKELNLLDSDQNNICRLIHGEGDGFPGLVVDYYNGTAIIQCYTIGMWKQRVVIARLLKEVLGDLLVAAYDKSSETLPKRYRSNKQNEYLFGGELVKKEGVEYGNNFAIDWETGQKTGFFIDQRENRQLLAAYSKNKKILNTFCYSGGFSIYALNAGAKEVHSLDSSEKAVELVEKNIALIPEHKDRHKSIVADAVNYIQKIEPDYDVIILDPPAFAKNRRAKHNAVQGYKRINAAAIKQIKPGGIIFTFSCSQVIDKELFNRTIAAAAIEVGKKVRILHQLHQPADHPVNIYHPEGEYLKGLVLQVY